jgi:hypothetical protein
MPKGFNGQPKRQNSSVSGLSAAESGPKCHTQVMHHFEPIGCSRSSFSVPPTPAQRFEIKATISSVVTMVLA